MGLLDGGQLAARDTAQAEPIAPARARRRLPSISHIVSTHGLALLGLALIVIFSVVLPSTFPTDATLRGILSDQIPVLFLAFGEMIVIACGQYDLSVGYGIGATSIIVVGLQVQSPHLAWPLAVLITIAAGLFIGLVNGLLVHHARINSFIATLGTGYAVYSFSEWYTGGSQISGNLPSGFSALTGTVSGVPVPAICAVVVAIVLWLAFEYLPLGRYMYALGSNERASELTGIPRGRYVIGGFMASGLMTGIAGVFVGSELGVGQSNLGPEYLLPAFVGALLGATTVRPGRVNVWGTCIAVLILAVGVSGLEQLGASFFVEPLFDGATLVLAVGLAGLVARRRRHDT
jgi:ribose transport system permease protein